MPDFMTRFFNRRKDCEAQRINLQEDHEVTKAIQKYVHGHRSEADVAILGRRRKAWKGKPTDGDTLILNIIRDIDIRLKERSRRMARPAALRQLGICYPLLARRRKKVPTVQLVPNRRHASSGYPYPDWFVEYGITREEWSAFISRIRQANRITPGQSALLFAIAIACEVFFFLPLLPFKLFAPCGAVVLPMYLASKRRKLRHAVNSGLIPVWTAAWNKTFFGPKGLCVGFDLPGPMFNDTFVHPKRKPLPWMRVLKGPLRRPMTPERAAHRARITIARVRSPAPKEGRVPLIDPIKIPRMQHYSKRLRNRPKEFSSRLEKRANDRMAVIESLRAQRELIVSRTQAQQVNEQPRRSDEVEEESDKTTSASQGSVIVLDLETALPEKAAPRLNFLGPDSGATITSKETVYHDQRGHGKGSVDVERPNTRHRRYRFGLQGVEEGWQ